MKTRIFTIVVMVALVTSLLLTACAAPSPSPSPTTSPSPPPAEETYHWKYQHDWGAGENWLFESFGQEMEAMSNGRIKVDMYPGGGLVAWGEQMEALRMGTLDLYFMEHMWKSLIPVTMIEMYATQLGPEAYAMKVLKSRLYELEKHKQEEKLQEIHDGKDDIAWGSQIRSYVLHPYQMAKDHRINLEIGNVNGVLDGAIDPFIEGVLLAKKT